MTTRNAVIVGAIMGFLVCLVVSVAGCSGEFPSDVSTNRSAVIVDYYCPPTDNATVPTSNLAWLQAVDGNCYRVQAPDNHLMTAVSWGEYVDRVHVASETHVFICDHANATGTPGPSWAPCWVNQSTGQERRIDGPSVRAISSFTEASELMSVGWLPDAPVCTGSLTGYTLASCGTLSDGGRPEYTASRGPADRKSGLWPDGTSGAPCTSTETGFTIVYACVSR